MTYCIVQKYFSIWVNFDISFPEQLFFQEPANFNSFSIINLHNYAFCLLIVVLVVVGKLLFNITLRSIILSRLKIFLTGFILSNIIIKEKFYAVLPEEKVKEFLEKEWKNNETYFHFTENPTLEFFWTIVPAGILSLIAIPSLQLLYKLDNFIEPDLTIKAIGNQWYWSYEFSDFQTEGKEISYESYLLRAEDLKIGDFRLRDVDNRLTIPVNTTNRVIVTSNDVIHCFTIPSMGFKIDAFPGRLNQIFFKSDRPGLFSGGCSEICGSEHGYMPITMEVVSYKTFKSWISSFGG